MLEEPPAATASPADSAPDFRHIETWIFDLDNTLYPASSGIFGQIDAKMTAFVQQRLNLDTKDAKALQKSYYRDHGTTLNGLMRLHGVDPDDYMSFVHDVDLSTLAPSAALEAGIARLPGRRCIFTNGCRHHTARVLGRLALTHLFHEVWDIRTIAFRPKPETDSYHRVLKDSGIAPATAAMFEDSARNLVPAHDLGMTTIWLRNGSAWSKQGPEHPVPEPHHIHYEIEDLSQFLHAIRI